MGAVYFITRSVLRPLTWTYLGLRSRGSDRIPRRGGVLIVANHCSHLDPVVLGCSAGRPLSFLARATLFKPKPFAWLLRKLGTIPLAQGQGDRGAIDLAVNLLREGRALAIFPEGTRSHDGRLGEAKGGAGLLALRAGVPILPAHIAGTHRSMPRGVSFPRPGRVRVHWGEPLTAEELIRRHPTGAKPARAVVHALMEEIRALGGEDA